MAESPGWLIVCSRCGVLERDGYEIEERPKTQPTEGEMYAVKLRHWRRDESGNICYDCPASD